MAEESVEERKERAENSTSPEELEKLAEDKDEDVRYGVAGNNNTPVSLLEKLSEDKHEAVRQLLRLLRDSGVHNQILLMFVGL